MANTHDTIKADAKFFAEHQDRFTYIRPMVSGEFCNSILPRQHEHHCTLVFQFGDTPGRVRLPVLFKPDDGPAVPLPFKPDDIKNEAVAMHGLHTMIDNAGSLEDLLAGWPIDDGEDDTSHQPNTLTTNPIEGEL